VLAVVALAIDRVLLPPPEEASAGHGAALAVTSSTGDLGDLDALLAEIEVPVPRHVLIGHQLEVLARQRQLRPGDVRDAFRPSDAWPDGGAGTGPSESVAERFKREHELTAVMAAGPGGYAIVDGRTLFIGQVLDGFTLVSVGPRHATLESGGVRVVLDLPE
jgi:hypothetical protein